MFDPLTNVSWSAGLLWLGGIATASFLVSWIMSELRPTKRVVYIPVLAVVAGALTAGYLAWIGAGASFWTNHWIYGVVGVIIAGGLLAALLNRKPTRGLQPHAVTAANLGWDGLVYGAAEGLLLSVLPVLVTWQTLSSNGWADGWRSVAAGAFAIVASVFVIVSHHLGYPDFRSPKMSQAVLACGILSIAYLLTGSVIAPIIAHAALHTLIVHKGMELPPHEEAPEREVRESDFRGERWAA